MTWRELRTIAVRALADAGIGPADAEARFMVERASGYDAGEWLEIAEATPHRTRRTVAPRDGARAGSRANRCSTCWAAWEFRGLDLFVDRRVLIPRPETEYVVEVALEEAARSGLRRTRRRLVAGRVGRAGAGRRHRDGFRCDRDRARRGAARCRGVGHRRERRRARRCAGERGGLRGDAGARRRRRRMVRSVARRICAARCGSSSPTRLTSPSTRSPSLPEEVADVRTAGRARLGAVGDRSDRAPARARAPTGWRPTPRSCARSRRIRPMR